MEQSNEGQKSALQTLRENIEKRKAEVTLPDLNGAINVYKGGYEVKAYILDIPEIKEPSEIAEFDLERYQQLTRKVDVIYNNYLVSKQEFIQASEKMAESLKLLAKTLDDTLAEGYKPRWS